MPTSQHIHAYRYRLEVESPLYIGDSKAKTLSPYSDYLHDDSGRYLLLLDHRKLETRLQENPQALQTYLQRIAQLSTPNEKGQPPFQLSTFIREELKCEPHSLSYRKLHNQGISPEKRQQLKPTIKTAGQPYLPGSSLKGAFRTAMLYHWLIDSPGGKGCMRKAIEQIERNYQQIEAFHKLEQKKKEEKYLPPEEYKRFMQLKNQQKQLKRDLRQYILSEEKLFGKTNDKHFPPDSQHLHISDSHQVDAARYLGAFPQERIRLAPRGEQASKQDEKAIPLPCEALLPGTPLQGQLSLRYGKIRSKALAYCQTGRPEDLLRVVRQFSLACINQEIQSLEQASQMPDPQKRDQLLHFYRELQRRSLQGDCFLRLGQGKTYFDNSLGLALLNFDQEEKGPGHQAFLKLRKVLFRTSLEAECFPVTRTVILNQQAQVQPPGWVSLHLQRV